MKIIDYVKGAVLVGGLALSAGCSYNVRTGVDVNYYKCNLDKKIQTTSVHPDDKSFLSGETTARVEKGLDFSPKFGLEAKIGGRIKLKVGGDVLINQDALCSGNYKSGVYTQKQQKSDDRPEEGGSFVYSQVTPKLLGYRSFVGVEGKINDRVKLFMEGGFIYQGFKFESGHDRYRNWSAVKKDEWSGWGPSVGAGVDYVEGRHSLGASVRYEQFEPDFFGEKNEIQKFTFGFTYKFKF